MKANIKLLIPALATLLLLSACSRHTRIAGSASIARPDTVSSGSTDAFHFQQRPHYTRLTYRPYTFKPFKPTYVTYHDCYNVAYDKMQAMLQGREPLSFEKAIFITENAYRRNAVEYSDFQKVLDYHTKRIEKLIEANDKSASMDFRNLANFKDPAFDYSMLRYTEPERKDLYRKALTNWAIFTYLTDTITFSQALHLPYSYKIEDPFAINDWANSQVMHLLGSKDKRGNCFALAALFKIFADRLNSEAYISTAPNHIYVQHRDQRGDFYNLDLATGTFPSDGLLQTLTFTYREGIMSGISLRRLKEEKQNIILCLVNLGKSYEYQFQTKDDDFLLKCAELALQYDSLSLNAMLLKEQVLEERIVKYSIEKQITDVDALRNDPAISETYRQAETHTVHLYDVGYRQMPRYMQEMILAVIQRTDDKKIFVRDRTPNPFTSINVPPKSRRYSTVSGGLYEEVHPRRDFEQYRRFTIDTRTKKIVTIDMSANTDFLIDPVVFAMSVDPMTTERTSWSPYNAFRDNPIINIDPTGALDDWYENENGEIMWDNNVNSQADLGKTGGPQGTYLGKSLTFTMNSYIDENLWDGPSPFFAPSPAGDKLTSTLTLTASENEKGELTGLSASKNVVIGSTPMGEARDYFPGLGADQNKFGFGASTFKNGVLTGTSLNFEQHASVSAIEAAGLNVMGYDVVNVAQSLNFSYANNRLSMSAATDVFPSATLTMNGISLFKYNQPSFQATHGRSSSFSDNGYGGAMTSDVSKRAPASFYLRFSK